MIDCKKWQFDYCCCYCYCRELQSLHRHKHPLVLYYCWFAAAVAVGNTGELPVVAAAVGLVQLHMLDLPRPLVDNCYCCGGGALPADEAADYDDDGEDPGLGLDNEACYIVDVADLIHSLD